MNKNLCMFSAKYQTNNSYSQDHLSAFSCCTINEAPCMLTTTKKRLPQIHWIGTGSEGLDGGVKPVSSIVETRKCACCFIVLNMLFVSTKKYFSIHVLERVVSFVLSRTTFIGYCKERSYAFQGSQNCLLSQLDFNDRHLKVT